MSSEELIKEMKSRIRNYRKYKKDYSYDNYAYHFLDGEIAALTSMIKLLRSLNA